MEAWPTVYVSVCVCEATIRWQRQNEQRKLISLFLVFVGRSLLVVGSENSVWGAFFSPSRLRSKTFHWQSKFTTTNSLTFYDIFVRRAACAKCISLIEFFEPSVQVRVTRRIFTIFFSCFAAEGLTRLSPIPILHLHIVQVSIKWHICRRLSVLLLFYGGGARINLPMRETR